MKLFVTGVSGQLGYDVVNEALKRGHEVTGSDITETPKTCLSCAYVPLDITDQKAVSNVVSKKQPEVIVHCAAWTAVDAAEDEENREKVFQINSEGTRNLAQASKQAMLRASYATPRPLQSVVSRGTSATLFRQVSVTRTADSLRSSSQTLPLR